MRTLPSLLPLATFGHPLLIPPPLVPRGRYKELKAKTRVLQQAALERIARQHVEALKYDLASGALDKATIAEQIPDIDEMVNRKDGTSIHLSKAVAMSTLFAGVADSKKLDAAQTRELNDKLDEYREEPEKLIEDASPQQLFIAVHTNMLWKRSGAQVEGGTQKRARPKLPKVPRFTGAGGALAGSDLTGAIGWLSVQITPLPKRASEEYEDVDGRGSGWFRRSGRRRRDEASSVGKEEILPQPLEVYATLRQGTLVLEEPIADSSERQVLRTYPMALWRCVGVTPTAFTKDDIGKPISLNGNQVTVGGEVRQLATPLRAVATNSQQRQREQIIGTTIINHVIENVEEWIGGSVTLREVKQSRMSRLTSGEPHVGASMAFAGSSTMAGRNNGTSPNTNRVLATNRLAGQCGTQRNGSNEAGWNARAGWSDLRANFLGSTAPAAAPVVVSEPAYRFENVAPATLPPASHYRLILEQTRTLVWEGTGVTDGDAVREDASEKESWLQWLGTSLGISREEAEVAQDDRASMAKMSNLQHSFFGKPPKPKGKTGPVTPNHAIESDADESDGELLSKLDAAAEEEFAEEGGVHRGSSQYLAQSTLVRERLIISPPIAHPLRRNVNVEAFLGNIDKRLRGDIEQSRKIDDFVIRPLASWERGEEPEPKTDDSKSRSSVTDSKARASGIEKKPPMLKATSSADGFKSSVGGGEPHEDDLRGAARREAGIIKEGYLLRKLHHTGKWGRRYFILTRTGQLQWYSSPEVATEFAVLTEQDVVSLGEADPDAFGQLTLRFFAIDWQAEESSALLKRARCEDQELQRMLPSCKHFVLRCGPDTLLLAWHGAVAGEWFTAITQQCMLNYQKSQIFSDKQISVSWVDDEVRVLSVGTSTTAEDIVKRLCRTRKRFRGNGDEVPIVSDSSDWGLFERTRHTTSVLVAPGDAPKGQPSPTLLKLPNDAPILDTVLLRWEMGARRMYGAAPTVPPGAFQLVLRKVRATRKVHSSDEMHLEFLQARDDLLDGRLRASLGKNEVLELGAVLTLWEMHDRGPRQEEKITDKARAIRSLLRQKHKQPTLDFDVRPEELPFVLPQEMWRTHEAADYSTLELKDSYKLLLSTKAERLAEMASSHSSQTFMAVLAARQNAVGVTFDSNGQVVLDKKAAERIVRTRLLADPLAFGSTYSVCVWAGRGAPLRSMLVAINAEGLHLHTWEREPRRLESFKFDWNSGHVILGWQAVEHEFSSEEDRELAASMVDETGPAHSSLVVHVLLPGESAEYIPPPLLVKPSANASASAKDLLRSANAVRMLNKTGSSKLIGQALLAGGDAKQRVGARKGLNAPLPQLGGPPIGGRGSQERESQHKSENVEDMDRVRAKLVLLTHEGGDMVERLTQFAQDHVTKIKPSRQTKRSLQDAIEDGRLTTRATKAPGAKVSITGPSGGQTRRGNETRRGAAAPSRASLTRSRSSANLGVSKGIGAMSAR